MWAPIIDWTLLATGKIDAIISIHDDLPEQFVGAFLAQKSNVSVLKLDGEEYSNDDRVLVAGDKRLCSDIINLHNSKRINNLLAIILQILYPPAHNL